MIFSRVDLDMNNLMKQKLIRDCQEILWSELINVFIERNKSL